MFVGGLVGRSYSDISGSGLCPALLNLTGSLACLGEWPVQADRAFIHRPLAGIWVVSALGLL